MWTCSVCDKVYQHNTHLRRHESTHFNPRRYKCLYCGNDYGRNDVCKKHSIICPKRNTRSSKQLPPYDVPKQSIQRRRSSSGSGASPSSHTGAVQVGGDATSSIATSTTNCSPHPQALKYPLANMLFLREIFAPTMRDFVKYLNDNANDGALNNNVPKIGQANEPNQEQEQVQPNTVNAYPEFLEILSIFPPDHASILADAIQTFLPEDDDFDLLTLSDPSRLPLFTEAGFEILESISKDILEDLKELHIQLISDDPSYREKFNLLELRSVITADNLRAFSAIYFRLTHPHIPLVHYPTFGTSDTTKTLLIAVAINGAFRSTATGHVPLARQYFRLIEEYVFRNLNHSMQQASSGSALSPESLQLLQASAIIVWRMLFNSGITVRRRAKRDKFPKVVAAVRHFGLLGMQEPLPVNWDAFIYQETCIRVASWMAIADWYYALTFYASPTISIKEMQARFPCPRPLWDATDATLYIIQKEQLKTTSTSKVRLLTKSVNDFIKMCMDDSWIDTAELSADILTIDALHITIQAIAAMIISACQMETINDTAPQLLRSIVRWETLWEQVTSGVSRGMLIKVGVARHSDEMCILATALLKARRDGTQHLFFDIIGHYSLQPLHSLLLQLST